MVCILLRQIRICQRTSNGNRSTFVMGISDVTSWKSMNTCTSPFSSGNEFCQNPSIEVEYVMNFSVAHQPGQLPLFTRFDETVLAKVPRQEVRVLLAQTILSQVNQHVGSPAKHAIGIQICGETYVATFFTFNTPCDHRVELVARSPPEQVHVHWSSLVRMSPSSPLPWWSMSSIFPREGAPAVS